MKIVNFEKQVGYPVTCKGNRDRTNHNKRATRTVARIARLPRGIGFEARARLVETNALPRYMFAIECGTPTEQSLGGLTSQIMRTLWPKGANMRSKEIVLAVLVKGHRTDPVQVWAYQTTTALRTMLRSKETWVPLSRQAWKAMQKKKSQTRHRGRGSQRCWSAQATWVEEGEHARGEDKRRRKIARHLVPRRLLEAQDPGSGARIETPPSGNQKSSKKPGETRHPNVHSTAEGKDADEDPNWPIKSNLGRCGPYLCQNVGARKSGHGTVPGLRLPERRPGSSLVDL